MITDIQLQNFRSYTDDSFELSPSVNIIVGPNASGKTNLLEAILVASSGRSYRAKDAELVQFNKPWARLMAHTLTDDSRLVKIETHDQVTTKGFVLNNRIFKRLSLQKTIPTVTFEPNDLLMLSGGPEARRQFLDELLEKTTVGFANLRRQYKRILSQRNALLKNGLQIDPKELFVWDIRLSELGDQIAKARLDLVERMNLEAEKIYRDLAGVKTKIEFAYSTKIAINNYATDLMKKLAASTLVDTERGFTTHGPHRDDLNLLINSHPIVNAASRGEMRTLILVCKILETKILEEARDIKPLFLLDDVFSELDGARRQALTKYLKPHQTFITTTDADVVIQHFSQFYNVIPISNLQH